MKLHIRNRLAALGRPLSPQMLQGSLDCYAELHAANGASGAAVHRDLAYGPDPRHRLDLFVPQDRALPTRRPVLMFVHGGGFVSGDKSRPNSPFYDNIHRSRPA
jgi:triacylglycerol lipase